MIRIDKPETAPDVLRTKGTAKRDSDSADYDRGARNFRFDETIYAHPSVKEALIAVQHGKCCFCESLVEDDGQIEHFRPKAAIRSRRGARLLQPGYYWLAYDWDNLFLCCPACNQQYKSNHFPLSDERTRARCHTDDCADETPLLIHPGSDDPSEHLVFDAFTTKSKQGSLKGQTTIDILKLNRRSLIGRRAQLFQFLRKTLQHIAELESHPSLSTSEAEELTTELRQLLQKTTRADAEFCAMSRALLSPSTGIGIAH